MSLYIAIAVKNLVYKIICIWTNLNKMLFLNGSKTGVFRTIANANTMPEKMKNTSLYTIVFPNAISKKIQPFRIITDSNAIHTEHWISYKAMSLKKNNKCW